MIEYLLESTTYIHAPTYVIQIAHRICRAYIRIYCNSRTVCMINLRMMYVNRMEVPECKNGIEKWNESTEWKNRMEMVEMIDCNG